MPGQPRITFKRYTFGEFYPYFKVKKHTFMKKFIHAMLNFDKVPPTIIDIKTRYWNINVPM